MWWDNVHARLRYMPQIEGIDKPGICRKHRPSAFGLKKDKLTYHIGVQPIMDADDGCAEHREQ